MSARFAADWRLVAALARRDPNSPLVFHRNGIAIRRWRTAWRTACQAAGVPTRFLHDCRRTAARNPPAPDAQAPRHVASILDAARELGIRDAQVSLDRHRGITFSARIAATALWDDGPHRLRPHCKGVAP